MLLNVCYVVNMSLILLRIFCETFCLGLLLLLLLFEGGPFTVLSIWFMRLRWDYCMSGSGR